MNTTGPRNLLGPVFFSALLLAPLPALAQPLQETLLRAKPAVAIVISEVAADVTVDCGDGRSVTVRAAPVRETGSGWFIHPSGWMITTAQVVAMAQDARAVDPMLRESGVKAACLEPALARRGLRVGDRPDVEDQLARQLAARVMPGARVTLTPSLAVLLPNGVRLAARTAKFPSPAPGATVAARDLALLKVDAENMPTLPLANSRQTKVGDRVHLIGFQNVVMSHELLNASATAEASVTGGAISSFKEDVSGQPVIQTDAAAAGGDSGGPAINDRGEVVGVMTFAARGAAAGAGVQGFNFVIPSASVREFLKDVRVTPGEPGAFTTAWAAGLRAFFDGDYTKARPHLAEANRLMPKLSDVMRITAENDERIKNPPPRPFPWRMTGAALAALGALGCLAAWADWLKRNRFRVRPEDIARQLDSGENGPVLLDVRDSDTYRQSPVRIPSALHVPVEHLDAGTTLPIETNRPVVAYCT